jgi:outer membrane protein
MKKTLAVLLFAAAFPLPASADFLGFNVGVDVWGHSPSGTISYGGTDNDLKNDLGLGDKTEVGFWASFEHPVPFLPNIKVAYNPVSTTGDGKLKADFGVGSNIITATTPVHSELTLDQLDGILYYELLDNVVSLDAGLDIKYVNGNAKVTGAGQTVNKDFSAPVPMLYANVSVALPFSGLSAGIQGSYIGYSGSHLSDFTVGASYESSLGLGATVGYRRESLKLKDVDSVNVDNTIDGPFGAVFYHF